MTGLVKTAYNESPKIALKQKNQINKKYSKPMRLMFERIDLAERAYRINEYIHPGKTCDLTRYEEYANTKATYPATLAHSKTTKLRTAGLDYGASGGIRR
ncbi:MAG: hypothetical protein ACLP5V_16420 [Candidatus Bathyarchaeia archaeon]